MTSEEKQKKAEEKARRRAEAAERRARRQVQLAALGRYWILLRYDVNGRACPQDFLLFWARQLIAVSKHIPYVIEHFFEFIRFIYFLPVIAIVVVIFCLIFPPLVLILEWFAIFFAWNVMMVITMALMIIALYVPILLAAVKRRINDVASSVVVAHARFLMFVATGVAMLASLIVCVLAWIEISAFMKGGALSFLTTLAYVVLGVGFVLSLWQLYYYSFKSGVKGENFAGANPVEVPLSESSLVMAAGCVASRSWQIIAFSLVGLAAAISFVMSTAFLRFMETAAMFDFVFKAASPQFLGIITYGLQGLAVVAFVLFVCAKGRYKKGDLGNSEIASINECFMPKSDAAVGELLAKAEQAEEQAAANRGTSGSFVRIIGLTVRVILSMFFYMIVAIAVVNMLKDGFVLSVALLAMAFGGLIFRNYFNSKLEKETCAIDWRAIVVASGKDLLSFGRSVALLPFTLSDSKVPDGTKLPAIARKRLRIRNMSFIDPLGIHQLMLGQMEMFGIQVLFCILFVGIPISWLWSIFDGIRFSRMTDEQFLVEYSDYCFANGIKDKFVVLTSKIAVIMAPILGALVLVAAVFLLAGDGSGDSKESICIKNMKLIETAYLMSKTDGKNVESISDLCNMEYLNEVPKCPCGGRYRLEDGRVICSVDTAKIEKQREAEAQKEADRDACIKNMEDIESAYRFAEEMGIKVKNISVKNISDLNEFLKEKLKDSPENKDFKGLPAKCPGGGKYKLDQHGRVSCSRSEDGHIPKP